MAQRTREIAVRVALGAQRRDVFSLVIRHGLNLALIGTAIGLVWCLAATRFISNLLYGVTRSDPWTLFILRLARAEFALSRIGWGNRACWHARTTS